jgi:hypothetical protein
MNPGIQNEYAFVKAIEGKKLAEMTPFIRLLLQRLFPVLEEDVVFHADKCNRLAKPDIYVSQGKTLRYLSIKSGHTDSIHFEGIRNFILFLRRLGVSADTQKTLLLYHYGDGTMTGDGKCRFSQQHVYFLFRERILRAEKELMNPPVWESLAQHCLFLGGKGRTSQVNFVVYGSAEKAILCSRQEILEFLMKTKPFPLDTFHVGPLVFQPFLRDTYRQSVNSYKRDYLQVKWLGFERDLARIAKGSRQVSLR